VAFKSLFLLLKLILFYKKIIDDISLKIKKNLKIVGDGKKSCRLR
jgi:hypothetical protein